MTRPPAEGPTESSRPYYFGIGCFTAIAGFAGGGMIAVLVAKIVGSISRCAPAAETGAPCNWFRFWFYGAVAGAVLLPIIAILLLRRARARSNNTQRG